MDLTVIPFLFHWARRRLTAWSPQLLSSQMVSVPFFVCTPRLGCYPPRTSLPFLGPTPLRQRRKNFDNDNSTSGKCIKRRNHADDRNQHGPPQPMEPKTHVLVKPKRSRFQRAEGECIAFVSTRKRSPSQGCNPRRAAKVGTLSHPRRKETSTGRNIQAPLVTPPRPPRIGGGR